MVNRSVGALEAAANEFDRYGYDDREEANCLTTGARGAAVATSWREGCRPSRLGRVPKLIVDG